MFSVSHSFVLFLINSYVLSPPLTFCSPDRLALLPPPFPVTYSSRVLSLPHSSFPFVSLGSPSCLYKQFSAGLHHFCGSFPNSRHTAGLACQHIHYTCACVSMCVFCEGNRVDCAQQKVCAKRRHLSGESSDGQSLGHSGSQNMSPVNTNI